MTNSHRQIVMTHWNAGVFRATSLPQLLPELAIYTLLYDEVLIREEDLITNRAVTRLLSDESNFRLFAEFLVTGLVKLLRLPLEMYPAGRRFDPVRLPISARVEEHQVRRSYKGNPWKPTAWEWHLFQRLDEILSKHPAASRFHAPFAEDNPFAVQLAEILEHRDSYRLGVHPVFRYLDSRTADAFIGFCREPETWRRFLHDHGVDKPIVGPDAGFYRSAAYQCSMFLPTPRAIRRLAESVYAATYCDRESSDGRYGGSELVELPYRYPSERERTAAADEARRIEIVPTAASAAIALLPALPGVIVRTRASKEFAAVRSIIQELTTTTESSLLIESRFGDAWRGVCDVYAQNLALHLAPTTVDHRITNYAIYAYVLARVVGFLILPGHHGLLDLPVAEDAAAIAAMEKWGPFMTRSFRGLLKIPALREQMGRSAAIRCSTVPLNIGGDDKNGEPGA